MQRVKNIDMFELDKFALPKNFRGRNRLIVQLWWLTQSTLFGMSPQVFYKWRVFLLRFFGAKIGDGVLVRPSARVTYPWKVSIGDNSWVGDDVTLYSLGEISIGANSVISQKTYLCTGSHDYNSKYFDIFSKPIFVGDSTWIASDVFVAPGVSIGDFVVVGARSSVFKDIESNLICRGSPAEVVGVRPANTN